MFWVRTKTPAPSCSICCFCERAFISCPTSEMSHGGSWRAACSTHLVILNRTFHRSFFRTRRDSSRRWRRLVGRLGRSGRGFDPIGAIALLDYDVSGVDASVALEQRNSPNRPFFLRKRNDPARHELAGEEIVA